MNTKKLIVGAVAATALTIGGGAALAAGPDTTTANQSGGAAQEEQDPSYKGSIQAPADKGGDEAAGGKETPESEAAEKQKESQEAQQLQSLAKIDQSAAEQAALQAVPGTVKDAELGNENGYVIWEVGVTADDGSVQEVKVDAGNGQVLAQEADDNEQGEANGGDEAQEPAGAKN